MVEVFLPGRYTGVKIREIDFEKNYEIQLVSVKRSVEDRNIIGVKRKKRKTLGKVGADFTLQPGDSIILFGESKQISEFLLE